MIHKCEQHLLYGIPPSHTAHIAHLSFSPRRLHKELNKRTGLKFKLKPTYFTTIKIQVILPNISHMNHLLKPAITDRQVNGQTDTDGQSCDREEIPVLVCLCM